MRTPREFWKLIYRNARKNGRADIWRKEDYMETRARFAARIAEMSENGMVAMVWSGRDCDGYRYDHRVSCVPATVVHVQRAEDNTMEWADGPCGYYITRPSNARDFD